MRRRDLQLVLLLLGLCVPLAVVPYVLGGLARDGGGKSGGRGPQGLAPRPPAAAAGAAGALEEAVSRYCRPPLRGVEGLYRQKTGAPAEDAAELLQVQVLHRHGDRSPIRQLPGGAQPVEVRCALGPAAEALVGRWPELFRVVSTRDGRPLRRAWRPALEPNGTLCRPGQLTGRGARQLLRLGRHFRLAYAALLGNSTGRVPTIYARSTDYQRTRSSAAALLSGLLGYDEEVSSEALPIQLHVSEPPEEESMLGVGLTASAQQVNEGRSGKSHSGPDAVSRCPRATQSHAEQAAAFVPSPGLMRDLRGVYGPAVESFSMTGVSDVFYAAGCVGAALPRGPGGTPGKPLARRVLADADRRYCERCTGQDGGATSARLAFQPFLAEVLANMEQAASATAAAGRGASATAAAAAARGAAAPQVAVFSAHDISVAPVAAALGFYDCRWPPLASHINFELWRGASGPLVRVLFDGRPVTASVPGCAKGGELCPLPVFGDAVAALLGGHGSHEAACAL